MPPDGTQLQYYSITGILAINEWGCVWLPFISLNNVDIKRLEPEWPTNIFSYKCQNIVD